MQVCGVHNEQRRHTIKKHYHLLLWDSAVPEFLFFPFPFRPISQSRHTYIHPLLLPFYLSRLFDKLLDYIPLAS